MKENIRKGIAWAEQQPTRSIVLFCFSALFLLYLLPTFIQPAYNDDLDLTHFYIGFPGVISGDEPHYFIATSSLINDHDYYVENNYNNAYRSGGYDLGFRYKNTSNPTIPPHIQLVDPVQHRALPTIMNKTHEENVQEMYLRYNSTIIKWVPNRPIGLPIFSSIFLWPLKNTYLIEHGAIYISVMISFIGLLFFYTISLFYIGKFCPDKRDKKNIFTALLFTCIFALSTQYWHYSKTYFPEPYIATFLLAAYYLFFIKKRYILPGFLLSMGLAMKTPFGVYIVLFGLYLLFKKLWLRLFYFILGASPILFLLFYYNWFLSGNIFYSAQAGHLFFGNYIKGLILWLFHPSFGMLLSAPFLVFSIFGFWNLWKKDKETFGVLSLIILPYLFFWTSYTLTQNGPGGYSARYLVPLLSFFTILTAIWYSNNKDRIMQGVFWILVGVSFIINIQAAFLYPLFWNNPPWIILDMILHKGARIMEVLKQTF
jgi:hypothetical protein